MNCRNRTTCFNSHVLANNTQIGYAIFDITGNIIVAQEQELGRKVRRNRFEFTRSVIETDAALFKKLIRIFAQPTGFL